MIQIFRHAAVTLAATVLSSSMAYAHSGEDHNAAPSALLTFSEVYKEKLVPTDDGSGYETDPAIQTTSLCGKIPVTTADARLFDASTPWHINVNSGAIDLSRTLGDPGITAAFGARGNATIPANYGALTFSWTPKQVKFCLKLTDHPILATQHVEHVASGKTHSMSATLPVAVGVSDVHETFTVKARIQGKKPKVVRKDGSGERRSYYPATIRIKGIGEPG